MSPTVTPSGAEPAVTRSRSRGQSSRTPSRAQTEPSPSQDGDEIFLSPVPETVNNEQPADAVQVDPPFEAQVQNICRQETGLMNTRLEEVIRRVDARLGEPNDNNMQLEIRALRRELAEIRADVAGKRSNPEIAQLTENIRILRGDVNTLLEGGSAVAPGGLAASSRPTSSAAAGNSNVVAPPQGAVEVHTVRSDTEEDVTPKKRTHSRSRSQGSKTKSKSRKSHASNRKEEHDTSSDSQGSRKYDVVDTTDDDEIQVVVTFFEREKGPKHDGLSSLKPSNPLYDRLMSYRYYRLMRTSDRRSSRSTGMLSALLKRMGLTMKEHSFSGDDPIMVFDFLTRFVEEADTLSMSEAQAFVALPHFLVGNANKQFRASRNGSRSSSGGVSCWPEAVQYLLRTYATPSAIRDAINSLHALKQQANESELDYSARVNIAHYRCGNVFSDTDKMNVFVDGLSSVIRTIVARYRESVPRYELTYERLVQFARDEGDAYRARQGTQSQQTTAKGPTPRRGVHFLDDLSESGQPLHDNVGEGAYLVDEGSVPTLDLPSTVSMPEEERLMLLREIARERSGVSQRRSWEAREQDRERTNRLICHACYGKGHVSPHCDLPHREAEKIVLNFESLSENERARVPDDSYLRMKGYIAFLKNGSDVQPQPKLGPKAPENTCDDKEEEKETPPQSKN